MSIEALFIPAAIAAVGFTMKLIQKSELHADSQHPQTPDIPSVRSTAGTGNSDKEGNVYETRFRSPTLLAKALNSCGFALKVNSLNRVVGENGIGRLDFHLGGQGVFQVKSSVSPVAFENLLRQVDDRYIKEMQLESKEIILRNAQMRGMILESDFARENGEIVLTFLVER